MGKFQVLRRLGEGSCHARAGGEERKSEKEPRVGRCGRVCGVCGEGCHARCERANSKAEGEEEEESMLGSLGLATKKSQRHTQENSGVLSPRSLSFLPR